MIGENLYKKDFKMFVDLDGVLCNFMKAFNELDITNGKTYDEYKDLVGDVAIHKEVNDVGGIEFWSLMEWEKDGKDLWNYIVKYNPIILSKPTDYISSKIGKMLWVERELGLTIPYIFEKDKYKYATPNSILIDDYEFNINNWIKAGGIGILHTSTEETIQQLKELGI